MGSASRSLSGNQAEKVVFNGSPSEYVGPQSAKPGLFSAGEPASAFEGSTGVVAGTVLIVVGMVDWWRTTLGSCFPGCWCCVFWKGVFGPVSGYVESWIHAGNMQFCGAVTAPCWSRD